ncbi:hypothetical protein [Marmoricola sp. OAE513]|uniref:hypothetical protein n=1 Tax=Marmoricola sp. OAE513 TaxID=2817894 RepID=UPI001AE97959
MRLGDLLDGLDQLPSDATIFAERPWNFDSSSMVVMEDVDDTQDRGPFSYLLEIDVCAEVVEVWSAWRAGRTPTPEQRCAAIVHYALHDAYEPLAGEA